MENVKEINKELTVQRILDKCRGKMNVEKFNTRLEADGLEYLTEVAELVGVDVAYID